VGEYLADKAIDVGIGVLATLVGIVLIYVVARPRVIFGDAIRVSRRRDGRDRFRVLINVAGRRLRVVELRITARILVSNGIRQTSIPVPLSRDLYLDVRRPKRGGWHVATRLILDDVDWRRFLPPELPRPARPRDLTAVLEQLDATLAVTVIATSAMFGVVSVQQRYYSPGELLPAKGSYTGTQHPSVRDRLHDALATARLARAARRRPAR